MKNIIAFLLLIAPISILAQQWQGTNPIYYNTGNIGIGTETPSVWFGTKTLEFSDFRPVLKLTSTSSTGLSTMLFTNTNVNPISHVGEFHVNYQFDQTNNDKSLLRFGSYPATEIMALQANGTVGIGTTQPVSTWGEKLHIYSPSSNTGLRIGRGDGASGSFLSYSTSVLLGSGTNHPLILMTGGNGRMTIKENGLVGIGTESPQALLHLGSGSLGWGKVVRMVLEPPQHTGANWEFSVRDDVNNSFLGLGYGVEQLTIHHNGNIGVGSLNPTSKLTVAGDIYSREVKVDVNAGTGPDYVFEPSYKLPSLTEIESYIKANKHLPEVPSAKEMEANGINLSEMNMLLLRKIEELTLHIIDQGKLIEKLQGSHTSADVSAKKVEELTLHLIELKREINNLKKK